MPHGRLTWACVTSCRMLSQPTFSSLSYQQFSIIVHLKKKMMCKVYEVGWLKLYTHFMPIGQRASRATSKAHHAICLRSLGVMQRIPSRVRRDSWQKLDTPGLKCSAVVAWMHVDVVLWLDDVRCEWCTWMHVVRGKGLSMCAKMLVFNVFQVCWFWACKNFMRSGQIYGRH